MYTTGEEERLTGVCDRATQGNCTVDEQTKGGGINDKGDDINASARFIKSLEIVGKIAVLVKIISFCGVSVLLPVLSANNWSLERISLGFIDDN